jgi:6-pyruvoyltetrahydropterin/6-carboxytetrahydropterin synthase
MFRLTREVRFALPAPGHAPAETAPAGRNGFGGVPPVAALAPWVALRVTLHADLDPASAYLRNIKDIDRAARLLAFPLLQGWAHGPRADRLGEVPSALHAALRDAWPGATLVRLDLALSPFCSVGCLSTELPMTRLSQKFEFSAAHRLHNPALSNADNRATYGKCNNPHGHGHNYELQVTLVGEPGADGTLIAPSEFERVVDEQVIRRFDHKHLNVEVSEFADTIPSVENIARVAFRLLTGRFGRTRLASVTVWETPKTWCEYAE